MRRFAQQSHDHRGTPEVSCVVSLSLSTWRLVLRLKSQVKAQLTDCFTRALARSFVFRSEPGNRSHARPSRRLGWFLRRGKVLFSVRKEAAAVINSDFVPGPVPA